ncbi:outer membrane beta-barrel protein, partial [bacterium]|nr:outer membrane beta-barrel protein [bacterium]
DLTTIPVSLNVGYSFLKEGKLDPYVSLGPTWFWVKIDSVEAKGKLYSVGDFYEDLKFAGNRKMDLDALDDNTIGFNIGFGLNYFMFKPFALCADARYYWGKTDFDLDNNIDVGGYRLSGGFKVVFGK